MNDEKTSGSVVTQAAVDAIVKTGMFATDGIFLRRIAYVESKDGADSNTYRNGYHGGIWQVDSNGFVDTQNVNSHPGLVNKFKEIKSKLSIDWPSVKWNDLRKPLYSALAARLYLSNVPKAIPDSTDVVGQAEYWKKYYNTPSGAGTVKKFTDDVKALSAK